MHFLEFSLVVVVDANYEIGFKQIKLIQTLTRVFNKLCSVRINNKNKSFVWSSTIESFKMYCKSANFQYSLKCLCFLFY